MVHLLFCEKRIRRAPRHTVCLATQRVNKDGQQRCQEPFFIPTGGKKVSDTFSALISVPFVSGTFLTSENVTKVPDMLFCPSGLPGVPPLACPPAETGPSPGEPTMATILEVLTSPTLLRQLQGPATRRPTP